MKNLTVLAAALAAGLTSFAANSAPHPSKSLRIGGSESAPVAKTQDKAAAKDEKKEKTTAKTEPRQAKKTNAKAEIVKTPLFVVRDATGEKQQAAEKSEPKSKRTAKKAAPEKKQAAVKKPSTRKQVAKKESSKAKQAAEKTTKRVAKKTAPKREQVVATPTPKPQESGDRQVAVREQVALDLVQTASLGSKGAKTMKGAGGRYSEIVAKYAASYGVPVSLAHAVIQVESNYRPDAKGSAGEIGLMQIKPSTARMMGYSGSAQGLFHPETNIKFGMKYLSKAQKLGDGTTCGTILKYNAGHGAKRMNPVSSAYCVKVKRFLGV